ncbi:MAG: hypothetical protein WCW02_00465 [Candidatus Buchananbacteria bacterium]
MLYFEALEQAVPCRYELSWQAEPPALILRVNRQLVFLLENPDQDEIAELAKVNEFKNDFLATADSFGFDGVVKKVGLKGEFVEYEIEIPRVKKESGTCPICRGASKFFAVCAYCNSTDKTYKHDENKVRMISASLTILLRLLNWSDQEIKSKSIQLLTVQPITALGANGGSMSGIYSKSLVAWLDKTDIFELSQAMIAAMQTCWIQLLQETATKFFVSLNGDGKLSITCPGNSCGLDPGGLQTKQGYEFSSHNADSVWQQLTLLVGLAVLYDQARQANQK